MELEYTTSNWPGYYGTYTLLGNFGEDGYGLKHDDIDMLQAIGYNMIFLPSF